MDGRDGAVLKVDGVWEIRFERHIGHPADKVWAAITGPGQMSRWFDETHMPDELKVGAVIRFHHAFVDQWSEGKITRLEPGRLIEWLWSGPFGPSNPVSWEVIPEPGGCRLLLRQQVGDETVTARTLAGWRLCLDRMAAMLDGRDNSGVSGWPALFERYKADVLKAGLTAPQQGAPTRPS